MVAAKKNLVKQKCLLQEMIIAAVELFSEHMRQCLMGGTGTSGALAPEALRARLLANLAHLREAYESLLKLDLPSQVFLFTLFICSEANLFNNLYELDSK